MVQRKPYSLIRLFKLANQYLLSKPIPREKTDMEEMHIIGEYLKYVSAHKDDDLD